MKSSLLCLLFLVAIGLTGCQTTHRFAQPGPGWKTWHGQLRYANPERSIIGDVVVSNRGASEFQLEFLTGPGFPLLALKQDGGHKFAKGVLSYGAPGHLKGWESLRAKFVTLPATATRLSAETPETGEHFEFRFGR